MGWLHRATTAGDVAPCLAHVLLGARPAWRTLRGAWQTIVRCGPVAIGRVPWVPRVPGMTNPWVRVLSTRVIHRGWGHVWMKSHLGWSRLCTTGCPIVDKVVTRIEIPVLTREFREIWGNISELAHPLALWTTSVFVRYGVPGATGLGPGGALSSTALRARTLGCCGLGGSPSGGVMQKQGVHLVYIPRGGMMQVCMRATARAPIW